MNLLARSACKEVRTDELSFIDHGLYNWDPVSSLCFMTFLCPEQKLMVTEAGSFSLPLFLEEKCFCISIRYMLYAEYLSLYPLLRLRFLEKYLTKNVENTMSEPLEPPPPLRNQSRLYCGCSSLLLAVPRITIFVEKTDETPRPQVLVERFMLPLPTTTDSLSAP